MAEQKRTVANYLSLSQDPNSLNMDNLRNIHNTYKKLTQIDDLDEHTIDEQALGNVCQQLQLIDDAIGREYLRSIISCDDINSSKRKLKGKYEAKCIAASNIDTSNRNISSSAPQQETPSVPLKKILCVLTKKMNTVEINDFISDFLFQSIQNQVPTTNTVSNPDHSLSTTAAKQERTKLPFGCILDLFIRHQLTNRGVISFTSAQKRFRLVEPISLTDDFSTWHFDHFHDLFDIWIKPYSNEPFPNRWEFIENGEIYFYVVDVLNKTSDDEDTMSIERPNTSSLESFIRDICLKENNGMTNTWLKQLREHEDITTYSHLANLKEIDWDKITKLSMNAKKTIKAYVDREKQTADDVKRKILAKIDKNENTEQKQETVIPYSKSELLANLHMIKLFICYTLKDNYDFKQHRSLAKLDPKCVELSFKEIREEGFSDDGLFDNMQEFFLPLTITEDELEMERHNHRSLRQQREIERQKLIEEIKSLQRLYSEHVSIYWTYDEQITVAQNMLDEKSLNYSKKKSAKMKNTNRADEQTRAKLMRQLSVEWKEEEQTLEKNIKENQGLKDTIDKTIKDYEKQLDEKRNQLKNIEFDLNKKPVVKKKLVKPHRGFIMFGPPGTGKSEIMSKLATKLGIQMIGPPLAAGELNRPLVGESERIIIALCSRCNRIPYTQCCVSIDEIDSLAPKRDEDSSEGKVDKISVLLSLIEGIKDIPNLMIFCATNRLHMMDEAFLRRMSGKFFVGRPSSEARRNILSQIPDWALEPEMLERLTIATTNFSGAAVGALSRTITVYSMTKQRTNPTYKMNYAEALDLADKTAKQYQISLGSETLPRLLSRNLTVTNQNSSNNLQRIEHLTVDQRNPSITYTGRIVVSLFDGPDGTERSVRIEARNNQLQQRNIIIEHILNKNETNLQQLLERITRYGADRNVQLLQLIDLNLLSSQNAYDEKKIFETLKERYDECIAYNRSLIVYDLDSLIGVDKSESESSMGRSTNFSVVNQNIYTYVRARFREAVIETTRSTNDAQRVEKWAIAVTRDQFLLHQFCNDVGFTRRRKEEEEAEEERRKNEDLIQCVKCRDFYIENENKMGSCTHHDGYIYDNSSTDLAYHSLTDAKLVLSRIESDAINHPDRKEEIERQKTKFKWICCGATLQAGGPIGGCKKGKHGFTPDNRRGQQQPRRQHQAIQRLDEGLIMEWEMTCRDVYNNQWIELLSDRHNMRHP